MSAYKSALDDKELSYPVHQSMDCCHFQKAAGNSIMTFILSKNAKLPNDRTHQRSFMMSASQNVIVQYI